MEVKNLRDELSIELKAFSRWIVSSLFDAVFLVLWVLIQWGVSKAVGWVKISGIDYWQLYTLQLLFAISTLIPIILYIITDTVVLYYKSRNLIRDAKEKYHKNEMAP